MTPDFFFIRAFGHSSESSGAFLTEIGGNLPTSLPELFKPSGAIKKLRITNKLGVKDLRSGNFPKKLFSRVV